MIEPEPSKLEDLCDLSAEKALLCCAIKAGPDLVVEILSEAEDNFFSAPAHALLWAVIVDFIGDDKKIEVLLLERALLDSGDLEEVGGRQVIEEIANFVPSAGPWKEYAEILNDFAVRRRVRKTGVMMQQTAYDREKHTDEITEEAEAVMAELHEARGAAFKTGAEVMQITLDRIEFKYANRGKLVGIPTGFPDIDRVIMGMEESELMFVGGRPSMGKTAWLMSMIERCSVEPPAIKGYPEEPIPAAVFSFEMPIEQIGTRGLVGYVGSKQIGVTLDLGKVRSGFLAKKDFPALASGAEKFKEAPVVWDDGGEQTIGDVKAKIRLAVKRYGVRVVFIDYVQLIRPLTKAGQREERLGIVEVCAGLKAVAKATKVVIVALAQVSRGAEENRGKKPMLKDFDGSSAIEKFGDYCCFVHRESKVKPWEALPEEKRESLGEAADRDHGEAWDWRRYWSRICDGPVPDREWDDLDLSTTKELCEQRALEVYESKAEFLIRKNRHGGEPEIPLRFVGPLARFDSLTNHLYSNNPENRQPENQD